MNGIYAIKKEGKRNYLRSIDFGIVERARQVLSLDKRVKSAKITLANGNVLINAKVVKDKETGKMKFEDDIKHAVYLPSTDGTNGQVKFEIDNEIIQGAKLEVEYSLQVSNISEVEYLNEDYYFYGEEHGQKEEDLVTLSADQVIDYLDNNITVDIQGNEIGEIIEDSEKKKQLISDNLLMDTQGMKDLLGNTNKIMLVNKLNKSLKPTGDDTQTGIEEISLKAYKLLSSVTTATEETTFENDAEIIKVKKTGGSSLITTPGNYVPSLTDSEYDDDKGETILILPPTGLSTDYISYTILAISSLGILVAGILLIKKFILRK